MRKTIIMLICFGVSGGLLAYMGYMFYDSWEYWGITLSMSVLYLNSEHS